MPESIFSLGNLLALVAWFLIIFLPRWRRLAQTTATFIIPGLLALAYTALIMVWWSRAQGGFNSLAEVRSLLQTPEMLLAGWFHYLAFDLLIGAHIARTFERHCIPHLVAVPILILTFLFGPIGYLASLITAAAWKVGTSPQTRTDDPITSTNSLLPSLAHWDHRTLASANVWLKPLKFQLSVALYLTTLAAFLPLTSAAFRRSNPGRFVVWGASFIGLIEIAYIIWRASRAEASHFNFSTLIASVLYGLMGIGAVLLSAASLVLAWGITRTDAPQTNPVFRLSVILGLILAFFLGGTSGAIMSAGTGHSVGTPASPDSTLPRARLVPIRRRPPRTPLPGHARPADSAHHRRVCGNRSPPMGTPRGHCHCPSLHTPHNRAIHPGIHRPPCVSILSPENHKSFLPLCVSVVQSYLHFFNPEQA